MAMLQDSRISSADLLLRDGSWFIISNLHCSSFRGGFNFRDGVSLPLPMVRKDGFDESCRNENAKGVIPDFACCIKDELST